MLRDFTINFARVLHDICKPFRIVLVLNLHEINEMGSSHVDGLAEKDLFVDVAILPALDQVRLRQPQHSADTHGDLATVCAAPLNVITAYAAIGVNHPVISSASANTQKQIYVCERAGGLPRPLLSQNGYGCVRGTLEGELQCVKKIQS